MKERKKEINAHGSGEIHKWWICLLHNFDTARLQMINTLFCSISTGVLISSIYLNDTHTHTNVRTIKFNDAMQEKKHSLTLRFSIHFRIGARKKPPIDLTNGKTHNRHSLVVYREVFLSSEIIQHRFRIWFVQRKENLFDCSKSWCEIHTWEFWY